MDRRLQLDDELRELLGSNNVYYQPPESLRMKYDCFVYELDTPDITRADDIIYLHRRRYQVTHIYRNPDNSMQEEIMQRFEHTAMGSHFTSDGLNHDVYFIYY